MTSPVEFKTQNYLVLKPNKAGPIKLVQFLWAGYIVEGEDAMILCPTGEEENLKRKWLISFILLLQMILLWIAKPMRNFGLVFEWFLNLPSSKRNWLELSLDLLTGDIKKEKDSASFISTVGHTDKRVKLDSSISRLDVRYRRALSAMAAKIAYENQAFIETTVKNHWKMKLIKFFDFYNYYQGRHTTQAFMLHDPVDQLIVVAFRGTEFFDADAWSTDLDISWYDYRCIGKVHGGFMKALGLTPEGFPDKEPELDAPYPLAYYTLRNQLRDLVKDTNNMKFIVTGHSLGGALAILFAAILALHKEDLLLERLQGVYTFGQPRVGDKDFQGFMEKQMKNHKIKYQRIVYSND
ncbi:triacylglycerol lipase OBL1 [Rosa chinensis]|uniref:triacylglycerol lipase OBL1 n=1 Tax=Rosa chinensis TaxID=74649 RepID=UPI000D0970CA|nr:triacylglycerol lipase OBL1 [Rosa chinensis]